MFCGIWIIDRRKKKHLFTTNNNAIKQENKETIPKLARRYRLSLQLSSERPKLAICGQKNYTSETYWEQDRT